MEQEGVAYMMMGDNGEMTPVSQPTQVVAIDNGDGTQQFAIPVIDPETGQETYMIIDPETAHSITNGGATLATGADGQQMVVVQEAAGAHEQPPQEAMTIEQAQAAGNVMVMLPNGEQGIVVSGGDMAGVVGEDGKQYVVASTDQATVVTPAPLPNNGVIVQHKSKLSESSSMIKIVGIQDKKPSPITISKPLQTRTSYTNFQPDDVKAQNRAPRKQSLGNVQGTTVPLGLTGDLFKDTEIVEEKVRQICKEVPMTEKEKERLRLNLMTKGLNAGTGAGRGKRVLPRTPLTKIVKPLNKTIKCDMCKKEFPANVDESVLINHVKTVHMNKKSAENNFVCEKCDKKMPTATALKYHTCSEQKFQCPDCNKLFMQKSTLVEHQAVAHRPKQPTPPPAEPEVKKEVQSETESKPVIAPVEAPKKEGAVKKLVDDWEEEDVKEEGATVPDVDDTKKPSRQSVDKSEDVDEDQIVADVDDILKETDTIMSEVDNVLTSKKKPVEKEEVTDSLIDDEEGGQIQSLVDKKKPTSQCEECYECFDDPEKLAWHALNDH